MSDVPSLSQAPASDFLHVTELANLNDAPTLGAQWKPSATPMDTVNPLLDNMEDLVITDSDDGGKVDLSVLTDNNFDTTETTRIVNLQVDRAAIAAPQEGGDRPEPQPGNQGGQGSGTVADTGTTGGSGRDGASAAGGRTSIARTGTDATPAGGASP